MASSNYYYSGCEDESYQPHFLDSCSLCSRSLIYNTDIFMYRGDTPFCSEDCRQEQIEMDDFTEKTRELSSSNRSNSVRRLLNKESSTKEFVTKKPVRTGTVAVA